MKQKQKKKQVEVVSVWQGNTRFCSSNCRRTDLRVCGADGAARKRAGGYPLARIGICFPAAWASLRST